MAKLPWSSGPGEILPHGLSLLRNDSIGRLRRLRNGVVHGEKEAIDRLDRSGIEEVKNTTSEIEAVIERLKSGIL
jgi:hypothetical protein